MSLPSNVVTIDNVLPPEILSTILFTYLDVRSRTRCEKVNKWWNLLINNNKGKRRYSPDLTILIRVRTMVDEEMVSFYRTGNSNHDRRLYPVVGTNVVEICISRYNADEQLYFGEEEYILGVVAKCKARKLRLLNVFLNDFWGGVVAKEFVKQYAPGEATLSFFDCSPYTILWAIDPIAVRKLKFDNCGALTSCFARIVGFFTPAEIKIEGGYLCRRPPQYLIAAIENATRLQLLTINLMDGLSHNPFQEGQYRDMFIHLVSVLHNRAAEIIIKLHGEQMNLNQTDFQEFCERHFMHKANVYALIKRPGETDPTWYKIQTSRSRTGIEIRNLNNFMGV